MKLILRQAAWTAGCFVLLYVIALAITFIVEPDAPRDGSINAWDASHTFFLTSPKYAFLGRDVLNVPDRKVIMVGASNTGLGLKQRDVQAEVPCAKVSNLAMGSSNITEVRQMIDLVHDVQDPAARRSDTFVIGIWFGMFVDTERLWPGAERHTGDTDLDIERYRYGFYRRTPAGPVAVLPPHWLHAGVVLIRPYLMLERLARWTTEDVRKILVKHTDGLRITNREQRIMTDQDKAEALQHWRETMGAGRPISAAQVALLEATIESLLQSGEKVVLVDLPLPAWHRAASPFEPSFVQQVEGPVFARFAGRPGFAALKMNDLDTDRDYSDEVHPKLYLARVWADRLGALLDPMECPVAVPSAGQGASTTSVADGNGSRQTQ